MEPKGTRLLAVRRPKRGFRMAFGTASVLSEGFELVAARAPMYIPEGDPCGDIHDFSRGIGGGGRCWRVLQPLRSLAAPAPWCGGPTTWRLSAGLLWVRHRQ